MPSIHPRLRVWLSIAGFVLQAADASASQLRHSLRRSRAHPGYTRRPGDDTPLWNAFSREMSAELQLHGAKARLARYLGIPKQRVTDFLRGRRRLPDAELTLRLLYWLAERRAGRDLSL